MDITGYNFIVALLWGSFEMQEEIILFLLLCLVGECRHPPTTASTKLPLHREKVTNFCYTRDISPWLF